MFVVIEWNQASHQPRLYGDDVFAVEGFALEVAADAVMDARRRGRRESYTVHAVDEDAHWDSDHENT